MKLSDILSKKDEIIKIAEKFGFTNVRITKNISETLNLVIDDTLSSPKPSFGRASLFSDYLSSVLKCNVEIFKNQEMGSDVVSLDKPLTDVTKEVTQLFRKAPETIHIQQIPSTQFHFFPAAQKKINEILCADDKPSENQQPSNFSK